MYDHILVPIAFHGPSDDGAIALAAAALLSNAGALVTLIHVMDEIPPSVVSYMADDFRKNLRAAVEAELEARAATMPNAQFVLSEGKPAPVILEWSGTHGVDSIVIASHQPGLQDWFLGSTAARVVRHAHCAVHVLR